MARQAREGFYWEGSRAGSLSQTALVFFLSLDRDKVQLVKAWVGGWVGVGGRPTTTTTETRPKRRRLGFFSRLGGWVLRLVVADVVDAVDAAAI